MKPFPEDIRLIPRLAWPLAILVGAGVFALLLFCVVPYEPDIRQWSSAGKKAFALGPALFCCAAVLLMGYIHADAARRDMRPLKWTLLAIFIPYGIGVILYFILRNPLPVACAGCGMKARASFVFCPHCGADLLPSCPNCKCAVDAEWNRCASCGAEIHPAQ